MSRYSKAELEALSPDAPKDTDGNNLHGILSAAVSMTSDEGLALGALGDLREEIVRAFDMQCPDDPRPVYATIARLRQQVDFACAVIPRLLAAAETKVLANEA